MEVKLEKRYPLDVDPERAWAVLRDVPATAECMPGAAITEQVDPTHYKGNVKVKVGPANAAFNGTIEVLALDEASRTLQLLGKGADRTGSSASMKLTAAIVPGDAAGSSVLTGDAEVNVTGKFAQFGGRMMVQVADLLLAQFADNFRAAAAALPVGDGVAVGEEAPSGDGATVAAAVDAGADPGAAIGAGQAMQPGAPAAPHANASVTAEETRGIDTPERVPEPTSAVAPDPQAPPAGTASAAGTPANEPAGNASIDPPRRVPPSQGHKRTEINGVALAWALIRGWLARLFGRG